MMLKLIKRIFSSKQPADSSEDAYSEPDGDGILINAYCTIAQTPKIEFQHVLNSYLDLSDSELSQHLNGFIGYVRSRGDGEMTRTKYHVIRHIERVQKHLSFTVEEGLLDSVADWAISANALLFTTDGSVRDTHDRILISGIDGEMESGAEIPFPGDAWQRKARTDAFLTEKGMRVPDHLPPLVSEPELRLRTSQEVAGRALALFVVAVRAESVASGDEIPSAQLRDMFPHALAYLSPQEQAYLNSDTPSLTDNTQFTWRYESLSLLQWALGLSETLAYPDAICDVPAVARIAMDNSDKELLKNARLRPANEILDALDLHYRLHWLVRQAQLEGSPTPVGLDDGVVRERHYALNWLVRFEDNEWDEIDTPT